MTIHSATITSSKVREALEEASSYLRRHGLAHLRGDARLDAEWLLAKALGRDRGEVVSGRVDAIGAAERATYRGLLERRAEGEPVAYILGEWEFFGIALEVGPAVLVPRPETELIVEWAVERLRDRAAAARPAVVADLGTGSGAIAIALAHERPDVQIYATDISAAALRVARRNIDRHALAHRVRLCPGDGLAALGDPEPAFDLIVSNPPYVAGGDPRLATDVARFEPAIALHDCDGDGLGFYRKLARGAAGYLRDSAAALLIEVGEDQADRVADIFGAHGFGSRRRCDLASIERALCCVRREEVA